MRVAWLFVLGMSGCIGAAEGSQGIPISQAHPAATSACAVNTTVPVYSYAYNTGDALPALCNFEVYSDGGLSYLIQPPSVTAPSVSVQIPAATTPGAAVTFVGDGTDDAKLSIDWTQAGQHCWRWKGSATFVSGRPNLEVDFALTCAKPASDPLSGMQLQGKFTSTL